MRIIKRERKEKFGFLEYSTVGCPCCNAEYVFRDDRLILILDDDLFLFPEAKQRDEGVYQCEECGITFEMKDGQTFPAGLVKLAELREKECLEAESVTNNRKRHFVLFGKKTINENEREL